jgi:hypothetical protein
MFSKKTDLALPLYQDAIKRMKARLGPTHPQTLNTMLDLGAGDATAGKHAQARSQLEETLPLLKTHLGVDHSQTLLCMFDLSRESWSAKRLDRAAAWPEEVVKVRKAKLGADHFETLTAQASFGGTYAEANRFKQAVAVLEEVHAQATKRPAAFPQLGWLKVTLADVNDRSELFAKSEPLYRQMLANATKQYGATDPRTAGFKTVVGMNLLYQWMWADAEPLLRETLAAFEKLQPDLWQTYLTKCQLGIALLG